MNRGTLLKENAGLLEAVFRLADPVVVVATGWVLFPVLFTLEENTWKDRTTIQMNIKDIKSGTSDLLVGEQVLASATAS